MGNELQTIKATNPATADLTLPSSGGSNLSTKSGGTNTDSTTDIFSRGGPYPCLLINGNRKATLNDLASEVRAFETRLAAGFVPANNEVEKLTRSLIAFNIRHESLTPFLVFDIDNTDFDWVRYIGDVLQQMAATLSADTVRVVKDCLDGGQDTTQIFSRLQEQYKNLDFKTAQGFVRGATVDVQAVAGFIDAQMVLTYSKVESVDSPYPDILSFLQPSSFYYNALQAGISSSKERLVTYQDVYLCYEILSRVRRPDGSAYTLAKLSDAPRHAAVRRLEDLGVKRFFRTDLVLSLSDTGVRKPNAKGMLELMRRSGVSNPTQVTIIGDSATADMRLDEQPELKGLKEIWCKYGQPTGEDLKRFLHYRNPQPHPPGTLEPPQQTVDSFAEILHVGDALWKQVWTRWQIVRNTIAASNAAVAQTQPQERVA